MSDYTSSEMMTVSAARVLTNDDVCFVGIGAPSAACNLARLTHAPDITLVYESGTLGARPTRLPLSIGDGELADTALANVSVPEMFQYWLQGGRISVGFLGAAQLDRYGNINTTAIGDYRAPSVRLPGAGGASEIATCCQRVFVTIKHTKQGLVHSVDFVTSLGFGREGRTREALGIPTQGPVLVITDLCLLEPEPGTNELVVTALHPGVTREQVTSRTGWAVRFVDALSETVPPTDAELEVLRALQRRTDEAQARAREAAVATDAARTGRTAEGRR